MYTVSKDTTVNGESIRKAIKANEEKSTLRNRLWKYYLGKHDISGRDKLPGLKNNRIVVNHAKYIVDVNVGYLLGNPVEYQAEEGINIDPVVEAYKKQTIADADNEIAKKVSAMGEAYDYTFISEGTTDPKTKSIDPRNAIMVYDDTFEHNELFAVMYSSCNEDEYFDVLVADKNHLYTFSKDLTQTGIDEHFFGQVPVTHYKNNPECLGDFEPVLTLIDAYNLLQSDRINDKEQLVEAVLVMYGFGLTKTQKAELKKSGVMGGIPLEARAEYLTKELNEADADVLRKVIEADIHKISMTPNLSDDNFVGNSSGVAIRYKLLAFEQNIKNKERYFERGLLKRFAVVNTYLNHLNSSNSIVEIYKVDAVFKRNLPQNDVETSQIVSNLTGLVSQEVLISQLSFIDDASKEVKKVSKENVDKANAGGNEGFGTNKTNEEASKDSKKDSAKSKTVK